ncbi:hypothetical protein [Abiotrophia defectiva]|nr:hypothetical protein [Abiotrophia defectiva]
MMKKLLDWLHYNKMLIPFIIWGVAISWFAIHGLFFLSPAVEDQPRVEIGTYKVDEDYAVTFIKQGDNLIVQLEQKVKRGQESVLEKSSTVFEKAFDPVLNDKGQGKVQGKLEELYKELLPKLASYQAEKSAPYGHYPAFGVAKYAEVEKLSINGQAVKDLVSHTDTKG